MATIIPQVFIKTVGKKQPEPELKTGYCLSCLEHCDFVVIEVCDAKNSKTEICKRTCHPLKQKPILDKNEKHVLDEIGERNKKKES